MVLAEEVINGTTDVLPSALTIAIAEIGKIALWLQALGIVIILWVAFQVINLIWNHKRTKAVYDFKEDINRIETKLDRIEKLVKK
jgi:hypothetical protein